jgi:DNA-binding NtrC family response regulator
MSAFGEPPITVLVADDEEDQLTLIENLLIDAGWRREDIRLAPGGPQALRALREEVFDVAIFDLAMPGLDGLELFEAIGEDPHRPQVVFLSGYGTVETATRAMKLGAFDFLEKPVDPDRLVTTIHKAARTKAMIARSERLGAAAQRDMSDVSIVTQDEGMLKALELVKRVAASDASVLVQGESGTGKELIARELHRHSGREGGALVALNCAAVAEALAESELFGHEKGAFTGAAAKKIGLVELADSGTLFLDEIGDLPLPLQAKLLRVLETRRFRRVGGVKEFPTHFRLVSATHRSLQKLVEEEGFRGDLFYRINAIVVELPPLRERTGDIPLLVSHFLEEFRPGENYPWPGNVRELRNVIERVALLARGQTIRASDLGASLGHDSPSGSQPSEGAADVLPTLDLGALEARAIGEALSRAGWHQGQAAEILGISPRTLHRKIRSLGLEVPAPLQRRIRGPPGVGQCPPPLRAALMPPRKALQPPPSSSSPSCRPPPYASAAIIAAVWETGSRSLKVTTGLPVSGARALTEAGARSASLSVRDGRLGASTEGVGCAPEAASASDGRMEAGTIGVVSASSRSSTPSKVSS